MTPNYRLHNTDYLDLILELEDKYTNLEKALARSQEREKALQERLTKIASALRIFTDAIKGA